MYNADFTGWIIVLLLLIINFLIAVGCLLYAIFNFKKHEGSGRRQYLLVAFCVFIGPVVTPSVILLGHLLSKLLYRNAGDLAAVTFSKERVETAASGDFELEANLIPIKEALSVSDTAIMRRLMLNVLHNGIGDALPYVAQAVESPDSETSHYAAAAIFDVLSDFRQEAAELNARLNENNEDIETNKKLLSILVNFLPQGVLHADELDIYTKMAGDVAENLFNSNRTAISAGDYLALVNAYIDTGNLDAATIWCDRAAELHPAELESYVARMRLCFEKHNNDEFVQTLDALKRSGVIVDENTMGLIRLMS